jgi:hypothetical protein
MIRADVKLVATDLDGTLLGSEDAVSARTVAVLRAAASAGVEVVAITGRSHHSAVPLLRHINAIRWIVCSNGASLYDQTVEAIVEHLPLSARTLAAAVESINGKFRRVGFAWETPDGLFHSPRWVEVRRGTESSGRFSPRYSTLVDQVAPDGGDVLKLLVAHESLVGHDWFDALAPHVPFGLSAATSGASFVEITEGGANKGAALARMCRRLGVDQSATVAFGDNGNDIDMLRWAGRGYAMANAHPTALAAAAAQAPHHHLDGVARVLEDLLGLT